jgi:hypothetical protein
MSQGMTALEPRSQMRETNHRLRMRSGGLCVANQVRSGLFSCLM